MIPAEFEYQRASSVEEAISLLAAGKGDAQLLAGGHSLIPAMKLRLNAPEKLIDISRIEALRYIKHEGNTLLIGAGTTHYDIEASSLVQQKLPLLSQAAGLIGDPAVRNAGTIGGSIAHADPAADWPACILATEATIVLKGANGEREVEATDFFQGLYMTSLNPGEIITEIRIPMKPIGTGRLATTYKKFMQPASRFAIVGCAVVLRMDRGNTCTLARVGITGVGDVAYRATAVEEALSNQNLTDELVAEAAAKAAEGVEAMGDHFASADYRKHLASVYVKRAVTAAWKG